MKRIVVSTMALAGLLASGSVMAEPESGVVCQPKTTTDAGKIRYTGNRAMNTSTTSTATVVCTMGASSFPHVTVRDANAVGGANISCTGFYYVTGLLSNAGTLTSSGTGIQFFDWTSVNIGETWTASCVLPAAAGAAETQMSSIESVQ